MKAFLIIVANPLVVFEDKGHLLVCQPERSGPSTKLRADLKDARKRIDEWTPASLPYSLQPEPAATQSREARKAETLMP